MRALATDAPATVARKADDLGRIAARMPRMRRRDARDKKKKGRRRLRLRRLPTDAQ